MMSTSKSSAEEIYEGLPLSEINKKDDYFKRVKRKPITSIFHSKEYKSISLIRKKLKLSEKELKYVRFLIKNGKIRSIKEETIVGDGVHRLYREGDIRDYIDGQRSANKEKLKEEIEKFREHHFIKRVVNRFFKEKPSRSKYFSEYEISLYLAEFLFKKTFKTTDALMNRLIKKLEKRFVMI